MTQQEYLEFHKNFCAKALAVSTAKNNDYARPQDSVNDPYAPFANFRKSELMGICTTEQGFMVRLMDKMCRVANLLKPDHVMAVKDEKLEDTLQDAVNYLIILAAYLETKRGLKP